MQRPQPGAARCSHLPWGGGKGGRPGVACCCSPLVVEVSQHDGLARRLPPGPAPSRGRRACLVVHLDCHQPARGSTMAHVDCGMPVMGLRMPAGRGVGRGQAFRQLPHFLRGCSSRRWGAPCGATAGHSAGAACRPCLEACAPFLAQSLRRGPGPRLWPSPETRDGSGEGSLTCPATPGASL